MLYTKLQLPDFELWNIIVEPCSFESIEKEKKTIIFKVEETDTFFDVWQIRL